MKSDEKELYKQLGLLTKNKSVWVENIPYVHSRLVSDSVKILAKSLWLLGEMGLAYPKAIEECVPSIVEFLDSQEPLLRERALNTLGRIGRADFELISEYWESLFRFANDSESNVRLIFIWASENIATNTPEPYEKYMQVFAELLQDTEDKVRMEAPEIFRVMAKRRPEFVYPYLKKLQLLAENDCNRVVRIHSLGAIKAYKKQISDCVSGYEKMNCSSCE